jgi:hypothetical protein
VIFVQGSLDIAMDLAKLIDKVKASDLIPKVSL